jgi:hypothetical protein
MDLWCILWPFRIVCGNLVYFHRFGMFYLEKSGNPAPQQERDTRPRHQGLSYLEIWSQIVIFHKLLLLGIRTYVRYLKYPIRFTTIKKDLWKCVQQVGTFLRQARTRVLHTLFTFAEQASTYFLSHCHAVPKSAVNMKQDPNFSLFLVNFRQFKVAIFVLQRYHS